jgi:hypothetical protein
MVAYVADHSVGGTKKDQSTAHPLPQFGSSPVRPMKKRIFLLGMTKGHVVTHIPFHDTESVIAHPLIRSKNLYSQP